MIEGFSDNIGTPYRGSGRTARALACAMDYAAAGQDVIYVTKNDDHKGYAYTLASDIFLLGEGTKQLLYGGSIHTFLNRDTMELRVFRGKLKIKHVREDPWIYRADLHLVLFDHILIESRDRGVGKWKSAMERRPFYARETLT